MVGVLRDRERGCGRAREWISLRVDGELSELERLLLRRHLGRCTECREFAEGVRAATLLIRTTPVARPSRSLGPDPVPVRAPRRFRLAAAAGLAALAAGVGVGVGVLIGSDRDAPLPIAPQAPGPVADLPPELPPPGATTANV
jgi:predicted anti-sigma-YlaC factor YlaD